jgi:tetratricopeptide (TPR) repeat protein
MKFSPSLAFDKNWLYQKRTTEHLIIRNFIFSLPVLTVFLTTPQASAQGLSEYGGLMAMPRGIPSGDLTKTMTRTYGSVNIPTGQTTPQAASDPQTARILGLAPGTALDAKKIKALGEKTITLYNQAKGICANEQAGSTSLSEAEKKLKEAITIRNSIWGYQDPAIPKMLLLLGDVYARNKQEQAAAQCFHNAQVYINKRLGPGSYERYEAILALANLAKNTGKAAEAISQYRQVIQIDERLGRKDSLKALQAKFAMVECLNKYQSPELKEKQIELLATIEQKLTAQTLSIDETAQLQNLKEKAARLTLEASVPANYAGAIPTEIGDATKTAPENAGPDANTKTKSSSSATSFSFSPSSSSTGTSVPSPTPNSSSMPPANTAPK